MALTRGRQFTTEFTCESDGSPEIGADLPLLDAFVSLTIPDFGVETVTVATGGIADHLMPGRVTGNEFTVVLAGHYPELTRWGATYDFTHVERKNASTVPSGDTTATGFVTTQVIGRLARVDQSAFLQNSEIRQDTLTYFLDYIRKDDSSQATPEWEFDRRSNPQVFKRNNVNVHNQSSS